MSSELPIRIIVGLGNPGRDYAETRHNVGFMVLDRLARRFGAEWKSDKARKGELAAGPGVLLIKPQTFMNCSGECVGPIMRYYKFDPAQVLVIYDDISFPVGTMRLRAGGSAGGHNGMKSLIAHLGGEKFPRLRVGIGAPGQKEMVGHVLGKFAPDERPLLEECLARAEEATVLMLQEGFQAAANKFNVKKEKKPRKKPGPQTVTPATEAEPQPPAAGEEG
ncbi:MAG: aminoacyl-tRNA hydrolase [Akkermansiaceae bacterium]|nr:aminoacyl-tRNA hydrolase [Akkermansiaceae bacterium]